MPQTKTFSIPDTIELVIFDCDGVLVDSEMLSQRVLLSMLKELRCCGIKGIFSD